MEKRFKQKINQLLLLTFLPYFIIILMIGLPLWRFSTMPGETTVSTSLIGIIIAAFVLLGMIYITFRQVSRLFWIKRHYQNEPQQVIQFLKQREGNYERLATMQNRTFQYRPTIKRRLYSDLLVILEKMQSPKKSKNKKR
jgi:hypothetical protein